MPLVFRDDEARMLKLRLFLLVALLSVMLPIPSHAETPPLQVWLIPSQDFGPLTVEYRETNGRVVASYELAFTGMWPMMIGGTRLFGQWMEQMPVFDPATNTVFYYPADLPANARVALLNSKVPRPDGQQLAYTVSYSPAAPTKIAGGRIQALRVITFSSDPAVWQDTVVLEQTTEVTAGMKLLGWGTDRNTLLFYRPLGNFHYGYWVMFWRPQEVYAYDLTTGVWTPLGGIDGYTADLTWFARVDIVYGEGVTGLTVFNTAGVSHTYAPPDLGGERGGAGGNVSFSPDKTRFAYQIARNNWLNEKIWTIVGDMRTGESYVVLEDEQQAGEELHYGYVTPGWLDNNTLAVGKAVIDLATQTLLREDRGVFLGTITNPSALAASGPAQALCPGLQPSRLREEIQGRVTSTNGVNVYHPGGELVGIQPEGVTFTVLSGPNCTRDAVWWMVRFEDKTWGHIIEADANAYFVEPS
jgi:hypothetical protein